MFYTHTAQSPFNFAPMLRLSPSEINSLYFAPTIKRLIVAAAEEEYHAEQYPYTMYAAFLFTKRISLT